ncbi:hypothetical protein BXZ70DRAFT_1007128 [Cristinia sonorae]|uniref:SHSP domain-containing protein n=1 Tax=Cristinia sonorae TaxID=1940300 RepID=A0A8K0UQV0_9AGAR|nr:hypothetical protein BXZ70DRAFT_1007128 [Cristinia sonorae]
MSYYSNPSTPQMWDVDNPVVHGSASISPEALQQPMPLQPQYHHQAQSDPPEQASTPSTSTAYQPPPTIQLQEQPQHSNLLRFDNLDETHFQQMQENPPRSSTRSSSRKPSSLRVNVDQSRPSPASSLGPSRVPHGSRQHGQVSHPYRRRSDGAGSSAAGGVRTQTGPRRVHEGGGGSEQPRHVEFHERQSRLGVGSDNALVGLLPPMVGSGMGTATASCPALHTWRVGQPSVASHVAQPQLRERSVSGGSYQAAEPTSPEAPSPAPIQTPGSAHTPAGPMFSPQMTSPDFFPPSVPQVSRASSMPPPPPVQRMSSEPVKHYSIRTDVHYDAFTNQMTAMLELPGLKKSDLKISMSVCPYSRVRQVTISGRSFPRFADSGYTVKERRFGAFSRTVVVPPDTKPGDVEAIMEDGILLLRVPGGSPAQHEYQQEIAIL